MPAKARAWYTQNERILYIIFIIVWITPLASLLISPAIKGINSLLFKLINMIVGLRV